MPIRTILQFPHKVLREKSQPVTEITAEIKQLVQDMFDTMYDDDGIGLAANQVGEELRVIVIDVSHNQSGPICLINPEIIETEGKVVMDEGCLSFPGMYFKVERAKKVKVKALDKEGESFELEADGLLARCILHEIDHIDGVVFTDYLSPLKLQRVMKKAEKILARSR